MPLGPGAWDLSQQISFFLNRFSFVYYNTTNWDILHASFPASPFRARFYTVTPQFCISYQVKSCFVCYRSFTQDYFGCALTSTPSNHSLTRRFRLLFPISFATQTLFSRQSVYYISPQSHQNRRILLTTLRSLLHLTARSSTYNSTQSFHAVEESNQYAS